jgi:hypothetical protein
MRLLRCIAAGIKSSALARIDRSGARCRWARDCQPSAHDGLATSPHTQNPDTQALQIKLDELIRATKGARNLLLDLENMDDDQIARLREVYEKLASKAPGNNQEPKKSNVKA